MNAIALPRIALPILAITGLMDDIRLARTPVPRHSNDMALLALLHELQVAPFQLAAVSAYKEEKLVKARKAAGFFGRKRWKWRMCFAQRYLPEIPIEVQRLMLRIRLANSETNFAVDYLANRTLHDTDTGIYYPDGSIDPFLWVRAHTESDRGADDADERGGWHPIAVWDEPDFKL